MHELSQSALSATLGELSTWIVHELSQPLTVIVADAQTSIRLLEHSPADLNAMRRSLEEILAGGRRSAQVLGRLRTLLLQEDLHREPVDLNCLIQEMLDLLHAVGHMDGVEVHLSLGADLFPVPGNCNQLRQVFLNVLLNAIEAMRTVPLAQRRLFIATAQHDSSLVQATLRDTGSGIASGILPRIFDTLVSTKAGAPGMGLRVAQSIVAAHGGEIRAEQHPEQGTVLHLTLPAISRRA